MSNNLVSVDDLKNYALKLSGELIDGTSDYDILSAEENGIKDLELINNLYKKLHYGGNELNVAFSEPFEWLKARYPALITMEPVYETGTISLTNGSANGTLSAAPAAGLGSFADGWYLKIEGRDTLYRIASHTAAATAVTLDQNYLEATGATLSFKLVKYEYTLTSSVANIYKSLKVHKRQINEDNLGEVTYLSERAFDKEYSIRRIVTGTPTRFTVSRNEDDTLTLKFNRIPATDKLRVEVPYIPRPEELIVKEFTSSAVGTNEITFSEHGLQTNQLVIFTTTGTLPTGLALDTIYYAIRNDKDTLGFASTYGGTAISITASSGSGTHTIASVPRMPLGYRELLAEYATYIIMRDKSDPRSGEHLQSAQALLQAIINEARRSQRVKSKNRGRLIPRLDDGYPTKAHRPIFVDEVN